MITTRLGRIRVIICQACPTPCLDQTPHRAALIAFHDLPASACPLGTWHATVAPSAPALPPPPAITLTRPCCPHKAAHAENLAAIHPTFQAFHRV